MTPYVSHADSAQYTDDGCEYSESCLKCPLPICKHDMPSEMRRLYHTADRDSRIFELRKAGVPMKDICAAFGVSRSVIWKIMRRGGVWKQLDRPPRVSPLELQARSPYRERRPLPPLRRVS